MFKTITRYPKYEIDEAGNIRNRITKANRKPYFANGRMRVTLDRNGKSEIVARLVAETHIPNPNSKTDVRHIDGNKSNIHISNLEWASHKDTQRDSYILGVNAPGGNMPPKRILIIDTGEEFPSIRSCARYIHGNASGIRQCLSGKISSYKGHKYKILP